MVKEDEPKKEGNACGGIREEELLWFEERLADEEGAVGPNKLEGGFALVEFEEDEAIEAEDEEEWECELRVGVDRRMSHSRPVPVGFERGPPEPDAESDPEDEYGP